MIFLTVGHELAFDRLAEAVDLWCAQNPDQIVFGQLAKLSEDNYKPKHFEWQEFLDPADFNKRFEEASIVIAHAGMGSIITALTMAKPILIMPRRGHLKETRNDHQVATSNRFASKDGVIVAQDETEFSGVIKSLIAVAADHKSEPIGPFAEPSLIEAVRSFIFSENI